MRILSGAIAAARVRKMAAEECNTRELSRLSGVLSQTSGSTAITLYGDMLDGGMNFLNKNLFAYLKPRLMRHGNPLPQNCEIRCARPLRIFANSANGKSHSTGCVRGRESALGKSYGRWIQLAATFRAVATH